MRNRIAFFGQGVAHIGIASMMLIVMVCTTLGTAAAAGNQKTSLFTHSNCTPHITSVSSFAAEQTQNVNIKGSCFGVGNTYSNTDSPYFEISMNQSSSSEWNACYTNGSGYDFVTCTVSSWTDNSITFSGFNGDYGQNNWVVNPGDDVTIQVWNAQTGQGPGICIALAGGSGTNCTVPPSVTFANQNWNCYTAACTQRVTAGQKQPLYQCAEFIARSLAYEGLMPGLASNSPQSAYGSYQPGNGKTYNLLLINPKKGSNTLAVYLLDFGLAQNIGQNLSGASAGDAVVLLNNGIPEHIVIITVLGSSTASTFIDGHNAARYHFALSREISGFSSWYILHF